MLLFSINVNAYKLNPIVKYPSSVAGFQITLANKGNEKESVTRMTFVACKATSETAKPPTPPL